jgi:hypothetical protein
MIRASTRLSRVTLATTVAAGLLWAPAALASSFDYYLKLPPIEGESDDKHKGEIEILSWSWGASQMGTGGMSAGKVSKVEALTIKQGVAAAGNVEYEWKVEEGESAPPPPGEAEITLKGSAAKGGTEDINIGVGEMAGKAAAPTTVQHDLRTNVVARTAKSTPPTVTLKRGTSAAAGGVKVAAGDLDGDGRAELVAPRDAASGLPTGKRQHKPLSFAKGSLSLHVPAGMCRAGARYPIAEFGTPSGVFTLDNVVVTSCAAASGGDRPMETLSLNYEKIR